ncbi:MAG: hypothetical protein KAH56_05750 [Candidatus Krumholzibacteria bacterium]|nr:hypothetical protein [Candidatus Krumholzibacteria bacterium]
MRRTACLLVFVLTLVTACDQPEEPVDLQVGTHLITVLFPADWEHVDFGQRHQFRKDFERISIDDLGPMSRNLDMAADRAMDQFGEDGRREVASRSSFQIDGRNAVMVDTWDHLSHQYRKRYVFVVNEMDILAIYMMQGRFEAMEETFDSLLAGIAFADTLVDVAAPDSSGRD